jgi:CubicO group peptidase (beta-lactamase class C family)
MRINHLFLIVAALATLSMTSCTSPTEKRINEAILQVMDEFQAVGVSAAVVKDGQIIYNQSFGYKDLETQTPLCNDDMMRIASISKSFTATSLMQLVEKGMISLDDDVSDLIGFQIRNPHHPEVPITLRMILSHTASIRDKEDYSTLDHLNPAVYGDCVESYYEYKPGEGYNYSNLGLNLAGTILEKVSGIRFDKYVKDSVINRLGLVGGHNVDELDQSKFAGIYRKVDGEYAKSNAYSSVAHRLDNYVMGYSAPMFSPTGGVKISARDLATYMMMHMNYGELNGVRIISEESAKTMQTPVWIAQNSNEEQYGLCLWEFIDFIEDEKYNTPGNYLVGHTGNAYGLYSVMIWSPQDKWGIVAMTNGITHIKGKEFRQTIVNAIYEACIKEAK